MDQAKRCFQRQFSPVTLSITYLELWTNYPPFSPFSGPAASGEAEQTDLSPRSCGGPLRVAATSARNRTVNRK